MGWAFSFARNNEKGFAIIISEKIQSQCFGSKLLNKLKQKEAELNGWVIDHNNDLTRTGN
jgi:hypothetical protein